MIWEFTQFMVGMAEKERILPEENQMLVRKNPFLPYALILTRQEIEKLGRNDRNVCTSFPVPIVEREKIEEFQEKYTDKIVISLESAFIFCLMKTCWMKRSFRQ